MPPTSAASVGKVALASLELMPAVSPTVLIRFQLASTALTVTLKAVPAVCAVTLPLLPVVVPGAEMYMAMKLGTIDGAIYGATGLQDVKLHEVVKYYTLPTAAQIALSMCINKDSLKKLPADLRETVEKTMPEIMDMTSAKYIQMCKDSLNKSVEIKSTSICNLPDDEVAKMRKLVTPLWDELAAKTPRMKKGVDILKTQMKDLGRPME